MDYFNYSQGVLHAEEVPIPAIAAEVGSPFYVYSAATLTRHFTVFSDAFSAIPTTVCFAVKCNSNLAVLTLLGKLGAGADTVSEGEIRRARAAGIPAEKIVFSGVGKTKDELRYALGINIGQFNVESVEELKMLSEVADDLGVEARVAIRVNPDVDAGTHDKISTGKKDNKFGIPWEMIEDVYQLASELPAIRIQGVTTHIGSQLTALDPFAKAFERVKGLVLRLREAGHTIDVLDLGGGLGIPYDKEDALPPHPTEYAEMIVKMVSDLGCRLMLEPGRLIAGNAGLMISKVIMVKETNHRKFVILDSAMNDLMRPALYDSYHEILPVVEPEEGAVYAPIDVVGPVCETTDVFAKDRELPPVQADDLVAFRSSGAYGAVMANSYNSRLLIPEIMVQGSEFEVIRKRPSYDELLGQDHIPNWI